MGDHEESLKTEYHDISMKIKLISIRFGSTFGTLRFNEKYIFYVVSSFAPFWDYKPTNAIQVASPGV